MHIAKFHDMKKAIPILLFGGLILRYGLAGQVDNGIITQLQEENRQLKVLLESRMSAIENKLTAQNTDGK